MPGFQRAADALLGRPAAAESVACADMALEKLQHGLRPTTLRFHGGVPDVRSGRLQAIGGLTAAALVAWSCGGPPTSSRPTSPAAASAPTGFTPFDGTKLGFAIALAPGWMVASTDLGSGASFG